VIALVYRVRRVAGHVLAIQSFVKYTRKALYGP
jgi:hypothetical protein